MLRWFFGVGPKGDGGGLRGSNGVALTIAFPNGVWERGKGRLGKEVEMETVSNETLQQAIRLLGNPNTTQDQAIAEICSSGTSHLTALRLSLFLPEAFGFVLASHMKEKIAPISTFSVQNKDGKWVNVEYASEPIFGLAMSAAQAMFHSGPRNTYEAIASRSSVMSVISDALNKGASIQGATMAIACNGIPAEIYPKVKRTLFDKFFDWRLERIKKAAQRK